jgi:hypothetical protein
MEIFGNLLQCRVHLSMFHSSPTFKIWYTSALHDVKYNSAKAQSYVVQKICAKGGQSLMSLPGTVEKNFSFHFKRYNLTIYVVNFHEFFWTCSPSSPGQAPMVESAKK